MADTAPLRGELSFEALGKTWRLKLGHAAYEQIELEMGKRFDVVMTMFEDENTSIMKLVRVLLKAGMSRFHPELTNENASDIIDDIGLDASVSLIQSAIEASAPKGNPDKAKN